MTAQSGAYLVNTNDYLLTHPPVAGTAVDSNYPVANLISLPISEPCRFSGFSAVIRADLGSAKAVNLIAIIAHNLSSTASISVSAGSTVDCEDYSQTIDWADRTCFLYLSTAQSCRFWEIVITDEANLDGQIDIGRLMIGQASTISRMLYGRRRQRAHVNEGSITEFGTPHFEKLYRITKLTLPFSQMTADEMTEVIDMINACEGNFTPLFLITNTEGSEGYFGRFTADANEELNYYKTTSLEFEEISPGRTIKEAQPFIWQIGDDLSDGTFTRPLTGSDGEAHYRDSLQKLNIKYLHEIRDSNHADSANRALLLEKSRTNSLISPEDFSAWSQIYATVDSDAILSPDGSTMADRIIETFDNSSHFIYQSVAYTEFTADNKSAFSIFAKAYSAGSQRYILVGMALLDGSQAYTIVDLGDGSIISTTAGHESRVVEYLNGWYRITIIADMLSGTENPYFFALIFDPLNAGSRAGDGVSGFYLAFAMLEIDEPCESSYHWQKRNQDTFYMPYSSDPQQQTLYARFIEAGTINENAAGLLHIGRSDNLGARLQIAAISGYYSAHHHNGTSDLYSSLLTAPDIGNLVELRALIRDTGEVQLFQAINGGVEASGVLSAANAFADSGWGFPTALYFNSIGTASRGLNNFQSIKCIRGLQTMETCRSQT